MSKPKATISIVVQYEASDIALSELEAVLRQTVADYVGNGGLTADTDLLVDTWDVNLKVTKS